MATQASLSVAPRSFPRRTASSTAWFWWKETRQLAPLIVVLIAVASLIVISVSLLASLVNGVKTEMFGEAALLLFPGLFATGAGPLLVGQERSQRTMDWLVLLPISAKRLLATKFLVALVGLAVMWLFSIALLWLVAPASGPWRGTGGEYSLPLWLLHSVFVLIVGFYVGWRFVNPFYGLVALIPMAFAPFLATSLVAGLAARPMNISVLNGINFWFTLLGIGIMVPLAYRAAIKALSPAPPPSLDSRLSAEASSPAKPIRDATPPRFGMRLAAILWQSYSSARGMLAIVVGMLLAAWFAAMGIIGIEPVGVTVGLLPLLLPAGPLAICWLGVAVFKHDGATERIRFLADRGISHRIAYCGLHAIPLALLTAALLVYGTWNLMISHDESGSDFATGLPTLLSMTFIALAIYAVSQWISQLMRTMLLAVILAPFVSLLVCGWLAFSFFAFGVPWWAIATCVALPFAATAVMMRRYVDGTDRPMAFLLGGLMVVLLTAIPLACAAWQVYQIPSIEQPVRARWLAEAQRLRSGQSTANPVPMSALLSQPQSPRDGSPDPIGDVQGELESQPLRPLEFIQAHATSHDWVATLEHWVYPRWHGSFLLHRRTWLREPERWDEFAIWLEASGRLLPALRRSTLLSGQEIADRLEVLLLDTLAMPQLATHRDDPAVMVAVQAIGTPQRRAAARRRAALVTWLNLQQQDQQHPYRNVGYLGLETLNHVPPGLSDWMRPRIHDAFLLAVLDGIEAAAGGSTEQNWRRALHALHQTGKAFEPSRYGDAIRSMPPMETMTIATNTGFGQLWGMDWEFIRAETLLNDAAERLDDDLDDSPDQPTSR